MHWQLRIELVKHMLSNAQQQPHGELYQVPDPVDCTLHLVDKHLIEPILGQEGIRRKQPSHTCFVCNVSKEALSNVGFGGQLPMQKGTPLTGVQYVSCALCIDPCFRLYHTEKDYISKIFKIARTSVKCIQKRWSTCLKKLGTTQLLFSHLLLHPNPSWIIYVLTV